MLGLSSVNFKVWLLNWGAKKLLLQVVACFGYLAGIATLFSATAVAASSADAGKYVRYTAEQVEALERVYAECPKPSSLRHQQLILECTILANIEHKQIKVWF